MLLAIGVACLLAPRPRKAPPRPRGHDEPCPGNEPTPREPLNEQATTPVIVEPPQFLRSAIRPQRKRRAAALACSAVAHCAIAAALWMTEPVAPAPQAVPKYRIQILHLQPAPRSEVATGAAAQQLWNALHQLPAGQASPAKPTHIAGLRRHSPAPQTLMVDVAPPDLKVNQAIPLPTAVSWPLQPLPPAQEQVRLDAPQAPLPEPASPPAVKMISLPQAVQKAQEAVAIPKVNQSADPDSARGESAGSADAPVVPAETAGLRAPDPRTSADVGASTDNPSAPGSSPAQPVSARPVPVDPRAGDPPLARIELPPASKPRTAILGESPQMPGRIVATVYVRVGLPKNWILEYWSQGSTAGLDAPWPYTMLRPDLKFPAEADAVMVRGRLNPEGRLEQLVMLAPAEWAQQDFLFRALEQWKFRAAAKNGQPVAVEVLLVIPRQEE